MKKVLSVLLGFVLAAPLFASTCETRVDQKWDKSTQERIDSCLNPEMYQVVEPELIVDQVYSIYKPKTNQQQPKYTNQTYRAYRPEIVYNEYLNVDHYPRFKNEFFPTQSVELASESAIEALQDERTQAEAAAAAASLPKLKNSKKSSKPVRHVTVSSTTTETTVTTTMPAEVSDPIYSSVQPTYTEEVTQAQELQADPLAPAYNETYTEQFMDNGSLGQDDFGYNSTDPALQQ